MPPPRRTTGPPGASLASISAWCRGTATESVPDATAVGLQSVYDRMVVEVMAQLVERRERRDGKGAAPSTQQDLGVVLQNLGMDRHWRQALALWQEQQQQSQQPGENPLAPTSDSAARPPPRKKSKKARQREAARDHPQRLVEQEELLAAARTKALSLSLDHKSGKDAAT